MLWGGGAGAGVEAVKKRKKRLGSVSGVGGRGDGSKEQRVRHFMP